MSIAEDIDLVQALRTRVATLEAENTSLRAKLDLFEQHSTLAKGIKGERIIVTLLGGTPSAKNAPHDIELKERDLLLEVKYANLNLAVPHSATQRWVWSKIFGEAGKKNYQRLILVGDIDLRYRESYMDSDSPYVLFDIPYEDAVPLTIKTGRYRSISLTTNPAKAKSAGAPLFGKYQITFQDLESRYGL
ncbi:hypothetical protein [Stutzerimonas kunmingensis]|jgi:hypothetical protein|uniref:hypothetical protein n=1 Tax=Stutzerimonas kunmingensis TaxID=1211807 RepID=UPI00241E8B35|nr:hypothetical protein [Stutzerimonas kunmingensis]